MSSHSLDGNSGVEAANVTRQAAIFNLENEMTWKPEKQHPWRKRQRKEREDEKG